MAPWISRRQHGEVLLLVEDRDDDRDLGRVHSGRGPGFWDGIAISYSAWLSRRHRESRSTWKGPGRSEHAKGVGPLVSFLAARGRRCWRAPPPGARRRLASASASAASGCWTAGEITAASGEVRFAPRHYSCGLLRLLPALSPDAGALATSDGTLYIYGGIRRDLALGDRWQLGLQFAAGLYQRDGGTDLGGAPRSSAPGSR